MHEYSTDPDVVVRLRDETEWAIRYRRRNVELSPDDAVALQARVELLTAALHELVTECEVRASPRVAFIERARAALAAGVTESEIEIDSGDLRVNHYDPPDATELSGAMRGVTITHIPTGIAFSHHSERSQLQNKARCYEDLKRRLAELAPSERAGVTESETP